MKNPRLSRTRLAHIVVPGWVLFFFLLFVTAFTPISPQIKLVLLFLMLFLALALFVLLSLFSRCPHCNAHIRFIINEPYCPRCGKKLDEPEE